MVGFEMNLVGGSMRVLNAPVNQRVNRVTIAASRCLFLWQRTADVRLVRLWRFVGQVFHTLTHPVGGQLEDSNALTRPAICGRTRTAKKRHTFTCR